MRLQIANPIAKNKIKHSSISNTGFKIPPIRMHKICLTFSLKINVVFLSQILPRSTIWAIDCTIRMKNVQILMRCKNPFPSHSFYLPPTRIHGLAHCTPGNPEFYERLYTMSCGLILLTKEYMFFGSSPISSRGYMLGFELALAACLFPCFLNIKKRQIILWRKIINPCC